MSIGLGFKGSQVFRFRFGCLGVGFGGAEFRVVFIGKRIKDCEPWSTKATEVTAFIIVFYSIRLVLVFFL